MLTAHLSPLKQLASEHALVIDPEFRALCPTQSADESAQLERSLLAEGCRDDLVAWQATKEILDGHNRHPLCERHGLCFGVVLLDLPDREACKRWILANQLARRNISALAASYFRGSRYLLDKGAHGGDHSNGEATSHVEMLEISTRLADEYHVARATIFRDGHSPLPSTRSPRRAGMKRSKSSWRATAPSRAAPCCSWPRWIPNRGNGRSRNA